MPRKKRQEIWKHFLSSNNNKSVKCKYCDKPYAIGNVNRMEAHLQVCFKCPTVVKQSILRNTIRTSVHTPSSSLQESQSTENTEEQPQSADVPMPSTSFSQTLHVSEDKKKYIDNLLSKAIFVSGAPIAMVEHPLWIKLFKELQPAYTLPNRKTISTKHLDTIYNQMNEEITEDLKSCNNLHLQCDGWSNRRVEGIINFLIAKPVPIFVKSLHTEANRHTSQYLFQEIKKVIDEYGAYKFATIIGDNASNLQKSFKLIQNMHPHITPLRCVAHTLNLLCDDCLKPESIKAFIKIPVDIIKTVKKSQVMSSLLNQIINEKGCGQSLKLPVKTRWGSYCTALKSVKESKVALQTLAVHENARMMNEDKEHLLSQVFWNYLDECINLLQPICNKIFILEANSIYINDVHMAFKDIQSAISFVLPDMQLLNESEKERILCSVRTRANNCLKPIHYAAYMLDPKHVGHELNDHEEIDALQFISEMGDFLNLEVMSDLANYRAREGFWGKTFVWRSVSEIDPVVWWKGICRSNKLSKVAIRLLTAPCTSAATERTFSVLGNMHSKKRNRLTTERAAKISFISYNWNLLNKQEFDKEEENDDYFTDTPSCSSLSTPNLNEQISFSSIPNFEFCNTENISEDD